MPRRTVLRTLLSAAAALAIVAAGCGGTDGAGEASKPPDYKRVLAGSPAPLAALHKQANQLLPGGTDAYRQRLAALRGYPVVVNTWASWCGPCRLEFPVLQKLSARYGKRVAFLGVDSQDSEAHARSFLEETPVPYPSYSDPDEEIAESIGGRGLPRTAFYSRDGDLCHLKVGQYADASDLEDDVRRFALGGECENG